LQLRAPPVPPSARIAGIPAALDALVMRLIAREPDARPRDAFEALDALNEVAKSFGGGVLSASVPPLGDGPANLRAAGSYPPDAAFPASAVAHSKMSNEVPARWGASLAELEMRIEDARHSWGERDPRVHRARELADAALRLHGSLERAGAAVADHLADVDRLEAGGREFRASLGRAIEILSRDRSRERGRLEVLAARRAQIFAGLSAPAIAQPMREALLAEAASLGGEEATARRSEADLGYQVETLQRELAARNERLEKELAEATGRLEGALSAARRVTREIARTREEALRALV
jgi:hypothetical protein